MMKTCCFCCSLKTGCMCIAIYNLIGSILGLLLCIGHFTHGDYQSNWEFLAGGIVSSVMYLIGGLCLLHGLNTKTSSLLLTWFVLSLIRFLAEIVGVIFIAVIFAKFESIVTNDFNQKTKDLAYVVSVPIIITMSVLCLDILFNIYCMHAVNSYRIEMDTADSDKTPLLKDHVPADDVPAYDVPAYDVPAYDVPAYDAEKVKYLA